MDAKEYLSQARFLDTRINSKIKQVESLNTLATSASSVLTGMPHNPNKATSKMADIVCKIVDLQAEINQDIDTLVDLKREIGAVINAIPTEEYSTILERRYLCFERWETIAAGMGYDLRWLHRLHDKALVEVEEIRKKRGIA